MSATACRIAVAVLLSALLVACQDDPADAPPVGEAAFAAPLATPAATTDTVPSAQRQADFRLAMFDAREQLRTHWNDCGADERCRERALAAYDRDVAAASREHGVSADEVVQLQSLDGAAGAASAPLVQLAGTRG